MTDAFMNLDEETIRGVLEEGLNSPDADLGHRLHCFRDLLTDLVQLRLRRPEYAEAFQNEEGELLALLATMQFLASDVRETRAGSNIVDLRSYQRRVPDEVG